MKEYQSNTKNVYFKKQIKKRKIKKIKYFILILIVILLTIYNFSKIN